MVNFFKYIDIIQLFNLLWLFDFLHVSFFFNFHQLFSNPLLSTFFDLYSPDSILPDSSASFDFLNDHQYPSTLWPSSSLWLPSTFQVSFHLTFVEFWVFYEIVLLLSIIFNFTRLFPFRWVVLVPFLRFLYLLDFKFLTGFHSLTFSNAPPPSAFFQCWFPSTL
jgi:hypothetical protein